MENNDNEDLLSARDLMAQLEAHLGMEGDEGEEEVEEEEGEENVAGHGVRRSSASLRRSSQRGSSRSGRRASRYGIPAAPQATAVPQAAAAPSTSRVRRQPTRIHRRSRIPSTLSRRSKEVVVVKKSARRGRERKASLTTSVQNRVKKMHSARGVLGRVNAALELARVG